MNKKKKKTESFNNNLFQINRIRHDRVKLNLINIIFFVEEMISAHINTNNIQITTLYCLLNFIKLVHIITFDDKLCDLYNEDKYLLFLKIFLDSCKNSKIIYTNYYIYPNEKKSTISKTIPETLMDIYIRIIISDKIKDDKNIKNYQEKILTKKKIIEMLNEIFLKETKNKKEKKSKNRTLFCYNDFYRYLFSKKITSIKTEINRINKDKILNKHFDKFGDEVKIINHINILLNKEKRFEYNFITFNIDKVYKYYFNIDKSSSIKMELSDFLEQLLTRLINEHEILYELNKDFFFKNNSNYDNYNKIKTKILSLIEEKKFDNISVREELDEKYSEKCNVSELVTSGLCENIKERKKAKNKTELNKQPTFPKTKKETSNTTNYEFKNDFIIITPTNKNISNSAKMDSDNLIINDSKSRSSSFISGSDLSSNNEEIISQSESSSNNYNIINFSPENGGNNEKLSSSCYINNSNTNKTSTHTKTNSNYSLTSDNSKLQFQTYSKTNLLEDMYENNNSCYFNKLDNMYLFNVKRDLMKNIFSINFLDTIFYDKTFIDLTKLFLQNYEDIIEFENQNKYLNYPTKIKNFSNGVEPPLFVKPFNNFFYHKTFPITHEYFYNYIQSHKQKYKYRYINLFEKQIIIPEKEKKCQFKCELIKVERGLYGSIIYSQNSQYFYFTQEDYGNVFNYNKENIYYDGLFSFSYIKYQEKENENINKKYTTNKKIPKEKRILILISEIEEIIERRFLLMWQGLEIFLKDGRSYFFNLLNESKYEKFKNILMENNELKQLIRKKDYLTKNKLITRAWEDNYLSTYEYLLLINKYASRSFNDPNQYYVFPWIITTFKNLIYISENLKILYDNSKRRNSSISNNKDKSKQEKSNIDNNAIIKSLRIFKYPVSLQNENNRNMALTRYNDEEGHFKFHLGTHYSTAPFIFYYLMRQEPYNTLLIKLQNYQQENPNRMFIGIKETVEILQSGNDNRELIPEFFSKIEFFINFNCSFYGIRSNNRLVNNVNIDFMKNSDDKSILISDYVHLIYEHKKLLNSYLISENINDWINNVFGVGQFPSEKIRKNCCNIFRKTTYEKYTNLVKKVKSYESQLNKKYNVNKIRFKIMTKINLILSFGQTPYQVFKEKHPKKYKIFSKYSSSNLAFNKDYILGESHTEEGKDEFEILTDEYLRPSSNKANIRFPCIYFELNKVNKKIFALSQNEEVIEINCKMNIEEDADIIYLSVQNNIKIPHIKFFDKIKTKNNYDYYIYKPKYAFSSFEINNEYNNDNNTNSSSRKNSNQSKDSNKNNNINSNQNVNNCNQYYKNIFENIYPKREYNEKNNEENYKFIHCRYIDNSFRLYSITKIKKQKKTEYKINSYSYICEDFVSSCCTISSNEFLIGLDNGKLIRWNLVEQNNKIKLKFDKNIQAHKGRINVIEIDKRLGLIITCGNDNYVQIRKLYNFELLTPIKINKKYIITMAKVSHINFLYIMCYDKKKRNSFIFVYTLTGIKFAKSPEGLYCNIDFTQNGNIVSLLNSSEICILNGYNLERKIIEESSLKDFKDKGNSLKGSMWLEFNFNPRNNINEDSNNILYIKKGKNPDENIIFYYDFKGNKIFD